MKCPGRESLLLTRPKQENIFHKLFRLSHLSHVLSVNLFSPEHGQGAEVNGVQWPLIIPFPLSVQFGEQQAELI